MTSEPRRSRRLTSAHLESGPGKLCNSRGSGETRACSEEFAAFGESHFDTFREGEEDLF